MNESTFKALIILIAVGFVVFAAIVFFAPIIENPDIIGVLKSGFVNPYATAYSVDLIACWVVLIIWIIYERNNLQLKNGWVCIPIGLTLGVVVGLVIYLLLRMSHFSKIEHAKDT